MNQYLRILPSLQLAIKNGSPVVALESAVITHGLPYPQNILLGRDMEAVITANHAVPATTAVLDGEIKIGLTENELLRLGDPATPVRKISRRDFGIAIAKKFNGGTTVCGSLIAAHSAGIKVFATGGIGGVHRDSSFDVSADLQELSQTPIIVTCAGAKAILDLPATVEVLETLGVPVIGYKTDEFPAFYSRESGLPVDITIETPQEAAEIAIHHWESGMKSAILVVVPPPEESSIPHDKIDAIIEQALQEAHHNGIKGAGVTPFLLSRVSELSDGSSLEANLALLKNNAQKAAEVAKALSNLLKPPVFY